MKTYHDLEIQGQDAALSRFFTDISGALPDSWVRDGETETRYRSLLGDVDQGYVFNFLGEPKASLFVLKVGETATVANIVPLDTSELTMDQYNSVLGLFSAIFEDAAEKNSDIVVDHDTNELSLSEMVSGPTAALLEKFSNTANKATGSSHPLDRRRWLEFVVATHTENSNLDGAFLERWLNEELNWPQEQTEKLVDQYDFARDVLRAYDVSG